MLTADRLREVVDYDPGTGVFTWKASTRGHVKKGSVAGSVKERGYRGIGIDGILYREHRLAFLYQTGEWPKEQIDHINGVRDDNRYANLREATNAENRRNSKRRVNNRSGFKGVSWHNQSRRWRARIKLHGKSTHLGLFASKENAYAAYCAAAEKYHGEFGRF